MESFNLRIYWNARSILPRLDELSQIVTNCDIFICVESWLKPEKNIQLPHCITYRKDRVDRHGGGILVLIRKNIAFAEIVNIEYPHDSIEICGIKIKNVKPNFNIIVCYRTPGLTHSQEHWEKIIKNINEIGIVNTRI